MKSRVRLVATLLMLAIAVGVGWWAYMRKPDGDTSPTGESKAEIVAAKRAARADAEVDRDPVTASGRVTRADDGSPIAGAVVLLRPKGMDSLLSATPGQRAHPWVTRTDAGGGFEITDVPPGAYTLSATAKGFVPGRRSDVVIAATSGASALDLALVAGGHRVSGVVSDLTGGQVEDAVIRAQRYDEGGVTAMFASAPLAALSDAEGRYELWLGDGAYTLTAEHPDYVSTTAALRVSGGPRTRNLTMTPGAVIEGSVVTRAGAPVPDAVVSWTAPKGSGGLGGGAGMNTPMAGLERVAADANGRFRIHGLAPGVLSLSAGAAGLATRQPVEVALGVAEELGGIVLVLDRAYTISGFVVRNDEDHTGIEGTMVSAWSINPPSSTAALHVSEDDGYFEIHGVQPGNYFVSALSDRALPSFMGNSVTVTDADVTDVLLVLESGVHLRGRVEPPGPATIVLELDMKKVGLGNMASVMGNAFVRGQAAADGTFDLFPVGAAAITLVATADDGREGRVEVDVGTEDIDDLVITLEPRARLAGRVLDAHGAAVEGVDVTATPTAVSTDAMAMSLSPGGGMPGTGDKATTDENGYYSVRGLEPGTFQIRVSPAIGPALAWAKPVDPAAPSAPIEVTLAAGEQREGFDLSVAANDGVLRGTVVDADGTPLADAWVRATREQSPAEYTAELSAQFERFAGNRKKAKRRRPAPEPGDDALSLALASQFAEPPVLTDAGGRFEIRDLREGTYLIVADGPKGSGRGQATGVALGSDVEIEIEPLGRVEGVVTSGGSPLVEYTVSVDGPDRRSARVHDEAGHFTLDRLDPGKYHVRVEASEGSVEADVEVAAAETAEVALKLEAFASLRGKLVDGNTGAGLEGIRVVVQGRSVDTASALGLFSGKGPRTAADGTFEVERVRAGSGSVRFVDPDAEGFESVASAKYDVEAGADEDLGTIVGVAAGDVPAEERGELGLSTSVATYAARPIAEDAPAEDAQTGGAAEPEDSTLRLWVSSVDVDGPAARAGVEPGDEIVAVRDVDVASTGASVASASLGSSHVRAGEDVELRLRQDSMTRRVTIRAAPRGQAP